MRTNDRPDDAVLSALRTLRSCDVNRARAERLRARCHRTLAAQESSGHPSARGSEPVWHRGVFVAAGAWCVLYLWATIYNAVGVYVF
jgi:hypothetical protein